MGEVSKSSGELGEKYVDSFLKLIGWVTSQSNESITCSEPEKHKRSDTKGTLGLDELYTYESPMDSSILIHTVISVKHTNNLYPTSPNSDFRKHVADLANTIECLKESQLLINNRDGFNVDREQVIGVLFWISSGSEQDFSVIAALNNPKLQDDLIFERIHVLDNDRMDFITKSINLMKDRFASYQRDFHYIETPNNLSDKNKQCNGGILPVEMLSSDIQVFKLKKDSETILAIVMKDEFNPDSLKRVLGLAHRLSNNLTSNVQIFYPSFEHDKQQNINSVKRIKNQFKEKGFINTTYIYGYAIGFKDTKESTNTSEKIPHEEIQEEPDNGGILPYGEHLRSLLNHSIISDNELRNLLQEKGVFLCKPTKELSIPILTSLLLSPKEFDILKESQKTKEDKEKRQSSRFKTEVKLQVKELKSALKGFNLNDLDKKKFKNYKYKAAKVNYVMDEEKKELTLEYEIERYERNKAWDEQINFFKGRVILDCSGNELEIITKSITTSKETLEINRVIINYTKTKLVENKFISKTTKEEKILMNDMSNKEILQFLLAFTDNSALTDIEFVDIISIDIEIDETVTLPDNSQIKWMESKIKKLKLGGKKIEDLTILTNTTNHEYLKCWGIKAKYQYDNLKGKGDATIEFKFNTFNKNEFFIQIEKCKIDKKLYQQKNIDEMVLSNIDKIKHSKHKEIISARSS